MIIRHYLSNKYAVQNMKKILIGNAKGHIHNPKELLSHLISYY